MSKLAQEFGLSDAGLKKVCRRNGISTPGLGYWPYSKQAILLNIRLVSPFKQANGKP
jgi:hypothetical protein